MESSTEYKIRHKQTGLYQQSGNYVCWDNKGKTWKTKGGLSNHVRNILECPGNKCFDTPERKTLDTENWEIEVIYVERTVSSHREFDDEYKAADYAN